MSRHRIASDPTEIIVGWDPPLRTYFLQIIDPAKSEEEELVLWLGVTPGALPAVEDLVVALAPYAVLPVEFARKLETEKAESLPPTPLQQAVIGMFAPSEKHHE